MMSQQLGLAGWLLVSFSAAAIGTVATSNAGSFYEQLTRPVWAPPASVFGPVWSARWFVPTAFGYSLLISPDDPDAFVAALRSLGSR